MLHEFRKAINRGVVVKSQKFTTKDDTVYRIDLIRFEFQVYFVKYKNDKIVECCNLNTIKPEVIV